VLEESKGRYRALRAQAQLRKKTTIPDPATAAMVDWIRRDFTVDVSKVNTPSCGDITYIAIWEGWLYLGTAVPPLEGPYRGKSTGRARHTIRS
jgi:transposase InsO family protein